MLHPVIARGIRFLLIVSGCIFASLMAMTVAGLGVIELNGGVVSTGIWNRCWALSFSLWFSQRWFGR